MTAAPDAPRPEPAPTTPALPGAIRDAPEHAVAGEPDLADTLLGRFAGRRALVTGAGSGIGLAVARRLVLEGASVIAADLVPDAAAEVGADPVRCDVTRSDDLARVVASVEPVDLCFANAGIGGRITQLWDVEVEEFDRIVAVNLRGVFLTLKAVLPGMVSRGSGAIVCTASAAGLQGVNWMATYCATKHAVVGLVRSVALDVADRGVRVNAVCPGTVKTPILAQIKQSPPARIEHARRVGTALVPMDRLGEVDEVATVVAFLLSDEASFMTGAAVAVDGGTSSGISHLHVTRAGA